MSEDKKKYILLVEDDPFLSNMYQEKLSQAGFKVKAIGAVEPALKILKEDKPDLILLDILLPGKLNGYVVLETIKKDSKLKDVSVVMLSNLSDPKEKIKAMNLGADKYIIKIEHTPSEVLEIIQGIINR